MAQYIDKSALVAEIERRKKYYGNIQKIKPVYESNIEDFNELLSFLDTLEVKEVEEEPISNDLEEAAHLYVDTTIEYFDSEGNPCCYSAFKAGAQWQKEQLIEKACEWLKENKDHPFIECEDPCLSGYLTDEFIEDFKKAMEK